MDVSVAEQMLDELLPSLEALEAQSGAIVQFLRDKGIATDEQLAPFLERARSASNVRWLAVRLRMNRLLTPAVKAGEETKKTTETRKRSPSNLRRSPHRKKVNWLRSDPRERKSKKKPASTRRTAPQGRRRILFRLTRGTAAKPTHLASARKRTQPR